jgi:hypothetical protein
MRTSAIVLVVTPTEMHEVLVGVIECLSHEQLSYRYWFDIPLEATVAPRTENLTEAFLVRMTVEDKRELELIAEWSGESQNRVLLSAFRDWLAQRQAAAVS